MPIGAVGYSDDILPPDHRDALLAAVDRLTDEFFEDVAALLADGEFAETSMADDLPSRYLPRYTPLFAKQFLVCVTTVAWKLRAPGAHRLACRAEELALGALIRAAEGILSEGGGQADFDLFADTAFEDLDFELLFSPALDGIDESQTGRYLGVGSLRFEEWFSPFRGDEPVHPYVEAAQGSGGDDHTGGGDGRSEA